MKIRLHFKPYQKAPTPPPTKIHRLKNKYDRNQHKREAEREIEEALLEWGKEEE